MPNWIGTLSNAVVEPGYSQALGQEYLLRAGKIALASFFFALAGASLPAQTLLVHASLPDAPKGNFINDQDAHSAKSEPGTRAELQDRGLCGLADSNGLSVAAQASFPPSMTATEKLRFAALGSVDPLAITEAAAKAGFYQTSGFRRRYGTGASAYFEQFGASTADGALRAMTGDFLYASLFHEDPRYFPRGRGSTGRRVGYALSRVFVTRSDSGQQVFNWSSLLGSATSAGLANIYLPKQDRTLGTAVGNFGWFLAGQGFNKVLQEFMPGIYHRLKHI